MLQQQLTNTLANIKLRQNIGAIEHAAEIKRPTAASPKNSQKRLDGAESPLLETNTSAHNPKKYHLF